MYVHACDLGNLIYRSIRREHPTSPKVNNNNNNSNNNLLGYDIVDIS